MSAPIETLSLDAGGVLIFPNWDRVSEIFASHGLQASADAMRAIDPQVKFAIDCSMASSDSTDTNRWDRYLETVLDRAGVPESDARARAIADARQYHAEHNLWESVPDDVVPALERLRALGLTLALASNANGTVRRCFERVGLASYFDTICDSFDEGVEKPDPRFFQIVLERSGGRLETTLHVGDLYHVDVLGARKTGLRAILLDRDDLYGEFDADRVRTLAELVDRLSGVRS